MRNKRIPDCNKCLHISITENEQIDKSMPHVCVYYANRVYYKTTHKEHMSYLYPCVECVNDRFINFQEVKHASSITKQKLFS